MRVLVLHSDVAPDAAPHDLDTLTTSEEIAACLRAQGHDVLLEPFKWPAADMRAARPDVVFNMVESVAGSDALAAMVPAILGSRHLCFTGSGAAAIALAADKPLTKRILRATGLATPDWAEPPDWDGLCDAGPWIVKSATEDSSLGLDDGAVVRGRAGVRERAGDCARRFGGRWFAERYIAGREFNAAILEIAGRPHILPLAEMEFRNWPSEKPAIVGYRAKWEPEASECIDTVRSFGIETREAPLANAMREAAARAWDSFGLKGYARIDFRVNDKAAPFVLEINPNPCLARDAGFAAASAGAGLSYEEALEAILNAARPSDPAL